MKKIKKWKRVTPLPPEYNGHGYLYECTECHRDTVYLGGQDYPPYDCPHCKGKEEKQNG